MSKEIKTLEAIMDEVAAENGFGIWINTVCEPCCNPKLHLMVKQLAERFASQAVEGYKEKLKAELVNYSGSTTFMQTSKPQIYEDIVKLIDSIK